MRPFYAVDNQICGTENIISDTFGDSIVLCLGSALRLFLRLPVRLFEQLYHRLFFILSLLKHSMQDAEEVLWNYVCLRGRDVDGLLSSEYASHHSFSHFIEERLYLVPTFMCQPQCPH